MSISAATSQAEKGTADPLRAVSVVSTGTVEIHPEHAYGSTKPLYWWLLTSRAWLPPRPIENQKITGGPVGVGWHHRQTRTLPTPSEEIFTVTAFEPDRRL